MSLARSLCTFAVAVALGAGAAVAENDRKAQDPVMAKKEPNTAKTAGTGKP